MKFLNKIDSAKRLITDENNRLVTDIQINNWNGKAEALHTHSDATESTSGFISSADKKKLDNIEDGAEVNEVVFANDTTDGVVPVGSTVGDMLKSIYDPDGDGIVSSAVTANYAENAQTVNGHTVEADVPADAVFTDTIYNHPLSHPATMININDAGNNFYSETVEGALNELAESVSELFTSVSNGKQLVADAITDMGVQASATDTFQTLSNKIKEIETGVDTSDANATTVDILSGKTAYVNGSKITGSISSKEAETITPGTEDKTIAAGQYLSGTQTIKGDANLVSANIKGGVSIFGVNGKSSVVDTEDSTATANDIVANKTAYVNGQKVTGTLNKIINLVNSVTFTGSYATELSSRTWSYGFNPVTNHVLLVLQGSSSTSYENVYFTLASVPSSSNITLLGTYTSSFDTSNPVGMMFGCILQGVTSPINISINVTTRNSTYDYYQAALTITYA